MAVVQEFDPISDCIAAKKREMVQAQGEQSVIYHWTAALLQ